ncbi:unnamed protein product, partial [Meganyctiphanes norvegica]
AHTLEFIELYRQLPSTWKVKSKIYGDRNVKALAYEQLVKKWRELYPDATRDTVTRRINGLRCNYRKEMKKVELSMRSGASAEKVYKPLLYYYKEISFLYDSEVQAEGISSMDMEEAQTTDDIVAAISNPQPDSDNQ